VKTRKAVITAAGRTQRNLPLQTLVDRDGQPKSALVILLQDVLQAGIEEIGLVISPGDQRAFAAAAGPHVDHIQFIEQPLPLGYGHAVFCAHSFTGTDPFLLLVGDHLYVSRSQVSCARQLIEIAAAEACAVSAVQPTHESKLPYYGAVGARRLPGKAGLYQVDRVFEKPTPTVAEQKLLVPDAGRPGPPQRALGARQSMDVPHGPPGRPPAAHPAGAARQTRATAPTRSCANAPRCAWT
jgi:UTP--glucose-1-phosphate uridylyltransferase